MKSIKIIDFVEIIEKTDIKNNDSYKKISDELKRLIFKFDIKVILK